MLIEYTFRNPVFEECPSDWYHLNYQSDIIKAVRDELYAKCIEKNLDISYYHIMAYIHFAYSNQKQNEFTTVTISRNSAMLIKLRNELPQEFSDVALALYLEV